MDLIELEGNIIFNPIDITKKHKKQSNWKRVAFVETKCDTAEYYSWFIERRFNLKLIPPLRGTHVTFINDIINDNNSYNNIIEKYNNTKIKFTIDNEPRSNSKHWWLHAYSDILLDIREECGLNRCPYFGLHMTIGLCNEVNKLHSEYILQKGREFGFLDFST